MSNDHNLLYGNPGFKGGRPKGTPNKNWEAAREFARLVLLGDDPTIYVRNIRDRILRGEAPVMEKFFAGHVWGNPKDVLALEGGGNINIVVVNYADVHGEAASGQDHRDSRALPPADVPTPIPGDDAVTVQAWDARVAPQERQGTD
jgi:hypothetical protein